MRNKVFGNILMSLRTMGYSINKFEYAASDKKSFYKYSSDLHT